jgi:hypothetical protein
MTKKMAAAAADDDDDDDDDDDGDDDDDDDDYYCYYYWWLICLFYFFLFYKNRINDLICTAPAAPSGNYTLGVNYNGEVLNTTTARSPDDCYLQCLHYQSKWPLYRLSKKMTYSIATIFACIQVASSHCPHLSKLL